MVDIAAISGALTSLRAANDITKAMMGLRDASLVRAKVIELQSTILTAQSNTFVAHTAQSALLERVRELEKQVADLEAWEAEKQRYELKEVHIGAFAYVVKPEKQGTEPMHWICANCYEHGRKSILQNAGFDVAKEIFKCFTCATTIRLGYSPRGTETVEPSDWKTA